MNATSLRPEITDRQRRILDYVTLVITRDDRGPSLREIGDACGITTTSVVDYNIKRLVEHGLLVRVGATGDQRRVRLPVNPWRRLVEEAAAIFDTIDPQAEAPMISGWRERMRKLIP